MWKFIAENPVLTYERQIEYLSTMLSCLSSDQLVLMNSDSEVTEFFNKHKDILQKLSGLDSDTLIQAISIFDVHFEDLATENVSGSVLEYTLHFENVGQYGEYLTEYALLSRSMEGYYVVLKNMLYFLKRRLKDAQVIYSHEDIEQMVGLLEPFTEVSQKEKQQHIEDLQTKCPYCGKPLVLRNGKYGQFWGCSAYPKCRFTRKAE